MKNLIGYMIFVMNFISKENLDEELNFERFDLQVLLGDMGTGKTSLVLRFVKGQFFDHQVLVLLFFILYNLSSYCCLNM